MPFKQVTAYITQFLYHKLEKHRHRIDHLGPLLNDKRNLQYRPIVFPPRSSRPHLLHLPHTFSFPILQSNQNPLPISPLCRQSFNLLRLYYAPPLPPHQWLQPPLPLLSLSSKPPQVHPFLPHAPPSCACPLQHPAGWGSPQPTRC